MPVSYRTNAPAPTSEEPSADARRRAKDAERAKRSYERRVVCKLRSWRFDDAPDLVDRLVRSGYLAAEDADDKDAFSFAMQRILAEVVK